MVCTGDGAVSTKESYYAGITVSFYFDNVKKEYSWEHNDG